MSKLERATSRRHDFAPVAQRRKLQAVRPFFDNWLDRHIGSMLSSTFTRNGGDMATGPQHSGVVRGGSFLIEDRTPDEVFTPEDITDEQRMFARTAEEFFRKEVIPREAEIYAKDYAVHRELMRKAGELGLLMIDIPERYGGLGLHKVSSAVVGEQFALQASFAGTQSSHVNIGTLPIVFFGTEEQKQKYLPRLATGEWIGAYALTEPQSGSDALAAKTKAVLSEDGTHYILNGQKMWITNGGFADLFTVFAKVDGEKFTAFLVERGPGLVSGHEEKKLGIEGSSTTALMLEDCRVPVENVLGEIGRGHKIAFNVLNIGRLKLGARSVGTMKISLQQTVQYAKERHQFGQPIANFGLIKHKLAEMTIRTYVGESILYRTLGMIDDALEQADKDDPKQVLAVLEQYAMECSIIKVWESEALAYVVDEEVQVFGGYGYSKDYPAEQAYRDARIARIYEGTSEINRIVIATQLLRRAKAGEIALFEPVARAASPGRIAGDTLEMSVANAAFSRVDDVGGREGDYACRHFRSQPGLRRPRTRSAGGARAHRRNGNGCLRFRERAAANSAADRRAGEPRSFAQRSDRHHASICSGSHCQDRTGGADDLGGDVRRRHEGFQRD